MLECQSGGKGAIRAVWDILSVDRADSLLKAVPTSAHQRHVATSLGRQAAFTHKKDIHLPGRLATLADGPDDEGLAAVGIAGTKDAGFAGHVTAVGGDRVLGINGQIQLPGRWCGSLKPLIFQFP